MAHFFAAGGELRDLLVPYFKAGLENNERCLWVTGAAFTAEQARCALRAAVPDLDKRESSRQIEIANGAEWYSAAERLRPHELLTGLVQREQDALGLGYAGLRTNGNCAWVSRDQWPDFQEYERLVQETVRGRRMICMCSYCVDGLQDSSHLEIMAQHDLTLPSASQPSSWRRNSMPDVAALAQQKRTFDLAMIAADMGTWRYTLADNICVYDENAQRLYGLTEPRFLHDEDGVKAKFHPDDLERMWSRVAQALEPGSDGRYDVEYRVRQRDGNWRWLSAWGVVEFEGEGPAQKPVAISGASRDLTKLKQAEELQRLLLGESNHRIKNTFATIQAITWQTLRTAPDLPAARDALDRRIHALAQAHDLLIVRAWAGANLADVVVRVLDGFAPTRVKASGPDIDISARHVLALSLALHELATNALKYGALSRSEGEVSVRWEVQEGTLHLDWIESGGPPVVAPTRKGFGSQLLEALVVGDLGGGATLDFAVTGVRCRITVKL